MKSPFFFISILGMFLFASCGSSSGEVKPQVQSITETVFASGELDADNRYNLIAQTEGYIEEFFVKEGDTLQNGDAVAFVNNTTYSANEIASREQYSIAKYNTSSNSPALKEAQQTLELAEIKLAQDLKNYERYRTLIEKNSIARIEFENAELQYNQSRISVDNAKERLLQVQQQMELNEIAWRTQKEVALSNKAFNTISALSSGVLVKQVKQKGDFVKKGEIVGIVADLNSIKAFLNVDENSIGKVKLGKEVDIRLNTNKDKIWSARITEISPMFDEATQSFICEATFKDHLDFDIIGTQLEANIIIGTKENVLLIPREYLSFANSVQLKNEDEPRIISTGIKSSKWVEVIDGITEEDVLIPLKK